MFKFTRKNKRELAVICTFLFIVTFIFIWIIQNIGLPIETKVENGHIKVIDVSKYNHKVNWKKVKDSQINHAVLKIGSGVGKRKRAQKIQCLFPITGTQRSHPFTAEFIIILMPKTRKRQ